MKISIQTLVDGQVLPFDDKEPISLKGFRSIVDSDCYLASVKGTVKRKGVNYFVSGQVEVTISLLCDRCLTEFDYPITGELWYQFTTDEALLLEDEDIKQVTKSTIDLSDAIKETIVMNLPMKVLCHEDCKGICTACGTNLNEKKCTCEVTDIDPRLEKLKGLFTN